MSLNYNGEELNIPRSIAIILDGNGRYAKKNNLPVSLGHKAGCDRLDEILEECVRIGIEYITVYAFSTENWKRSESEINSLFQLFNLYLPRVSDKAVKNGIKISFIGDLTKFPKNIQDSCEKVKEMTKDNNKSNFIVAFNYGGRDEIIRTTKKIIKDYNDGIIKIDDITEETYKNYLDTKDIPDPDLLIRTSGEIRLSNFLLYQIAYSEIYITDVLWPEFTKEELYKAIYSYNKRDRRYGKRKEAQ